MFSVLTNVVPCKLMNVKLSLSSVSQCVFEDIPRPTRDTYLEGRRFRKAEQEIAEFVMVSVIFIKAVDKEAELGDTVSFPV